MANTDPRDDQSLLAQARLAGLDKVVDAAPDDVLVAARVVETLRAQFKPCEDLTRELSPVMSVKE